MHSTTHSLDSLEGPASPGSGSSPRPFVPLARLSLRTAVWSVLLGIAVVCPAMLIASLFPVSFVNRQDTVTVLLFPGMMLLKHVLAGPLLEELIFRGLILQLARRYASLRTAILVSATLFTLLHLPKGIATTAIAFPLGCMLAWLAVRSGSLLPSFLCHATINAAGAFVITPMFGISDKVAVLPASGGGFLAPLGLFPAWWIAVSLLGIIVSVTVLVRGFRARDRAAAHGSPVAA